MRLFASQSCAAPPATRPVRELEPGSGGGARRGDGEVRPAPGGRGQAAADPDVHPGAPLESTPSATGVGGAPQDGPQPACAAGRHRRRTSSCWCRTAAFVAALGYSRESGLPLEFGLIRNHYVGRTFIEPKQSIRNFGVKIKLNPVRELIAGKRVVLVDDSIVRGTTSKKIVHMVREAGAAEVHVRISAPPTQWPCRYGIDTPTRAELIAASHDVEGIREFIEADSLGYLSLDGMLAAVSGPKDSYCTACWTGDYRVPISPQDQRQAELFPIRAEGE